MGKNWTPMQRQAIDARNKTLLISAAAGSGKTATLTERIVRKLTDEEAPASISRMLIVTFTRLSAADLKRKISSAISEELIKNPTSKHLSKQLVMLESARICTIDSFYLDLVRSNFQRLGLPSNFRLADEGEMALLRKEVMDSIIEKHYDASSENDDGFLSFVENFTSAKQSDALSEVFLNLHEKLASKLEGISILLSLANELETEADGFFFDSRQGKVIYSYLLSGAKSYYKTLEHCCSIILEEEHASTAYLAAFSSDKKFFENLVLALEENDYNKSRDLVLSFKPQNLKNLSKEYKTDEIVACLSFREEEKKFIEGIAPKYFSLDEDSIKQTMRETAKILRSLYNVLAEFEEEGLKEKIKRKAFAFADISHFAYELLTNEDGSPSDIALAYKEQYDEIYIDEYQDVDMLQDKIFTLISRGNNRFMVGDIKQSIYGFRGADSDVFASYKKSFPLYDESSDDDCGLIFMSNNFRCDDNVIKFTNKIFSFLFGNCGESIEYTPSDDLIFSKDEPGRTLPSPKVNVAVFPKQPKDEESDKEESIDINGEALWIAKEIDRLIKYERKADDTKIEPRDIAIIMRTVTPASDIARALALYNIPCADNTKFDLFETPDVLLVLSLLSTIDNPHRDIPCAASLYSPIFSYTMDELIEIRKSADPSLSIFEALKEYSGSNETIKAKNEYFISKLTEYRSKATSMPIDKLLSYIYRDLSMSSYENANSKNLTRLYEMARLFESGSFKGLNNFISYINELIANKKVPSFTLSDADSNAVQMVTAHKSKGLEFPVCFVCNTHHRFNMDDLSENLLYHPRVGIGLKLAYEGGMACLNTPIREAVAIELYNAQIDEEMRILYVALTRARERLYISAHTQSYLNTLNEKAYMTSTFANDFNIRRCNSWLSMILGAIYPLKDGISYNFTEIEKDDLIDYFEQDNSTEKVVKTSAGLTNEEMETIRRRLDFSYSYAHLSKLPAKLSVSKLTPTVLDDIDNDAATLESFDEAKILEIEEFFESKSKSTSADRGTATHLFLQFCNFENAEKNGVENELARLVSKAFISPQVAELINKNQIAKFFESDFYKLLKNAKKTYREQRFNILLPASHFTQDADFKDDIKDEEILVQGVIDLFFEDKNGNIILCDYKTDYLTPEEAGNEPLVIKKMTERHGRQLEYYSMAIERFLGKRPDSILIYSLPFGEAVEIKL